MLVTEANSNHVVDQEFHRLPFFVCIGSRLRLCRSVGGETCCCPMTHSKCDLRSPGDPPLSPHSSWHFWKGHHVISSIQIV